MKRSNKNEQQRHTHPNTQDIVDKFEEIFQENDQNFEISSRIFDRSVSTCTSSYPPWGVRRYMLEQIEVSLMATEMLLLRIIKKKCKLRQLERRGKICDIIFLNCAQ